MKKQPSRAVPRQKTPPVFSYTSACCSVQATKSPCYSFGAKSKEAETQGLGHFRCTACQKPCKVSRHKNSEKVLDKAPEAVVV